MKIRMFKDDTFEFCGCVEKKDLIVRGDEQYKTIMGRAKFYLVGLILMSVLFAMTCILSSASYKSLRDEYTALEELLEVERSNNTTEMLIGRYAMLGATPAPTEEEVVELLRELKPVHPDVIMAQCMLESGIGKSALAHDNNNYFGMKRCSKGAVTTQIGENRGYGVYKNWQMSVIDRYLWDVRMFGDSIPGDHDEYIAHLDRRYAEDGSYAKKLKRVIENNAYDTIRFND